MKGRGGLSGSTFQTAGATSAKALRQVRAVRWKPEAAGRAVRSKPEIMGGGGYRSADAKGLLGHYWDLGFDSG